MSDETTRIERLRELAGIGAGHAAAALGELIGRRVRSQPPRIGSGETKAGACTLAVCFDVYGGPGGVLAVVFPEKELDTLLDAMLGAPEPERIDQVESALQEVGNILASHALSAVADVLGSPVLPSVPRLDSVLPAGHGVRLETDLVDSEGVVHGTLVWRVGR